MRHMLFHEFPRVKENDQGITRLLSDFDYLVEGKNRNVYLSIDEALHDEMTDLIEFLGC